MKEVLFILLPKIQSEVVAQLKKAVLWIMRLEGNVDLVSITKCHTGFSCVFGLRSAGIVVPVLPEDAHPVKPKKRGGEICAAIGCHNTRYNCALSMFRFPRDHDR